MKRLLTMMLALAGAMTVMLVPAGPASAHTGVHGITISGSIYVNDADWPDPDDVGGIPINASLVLTGSAPQAGTTFIHCVDEVRAVLNVNVSHNPSPFADWSVLVRTTAYIFEGTAGCNSLSLDATSTRTFTVQPYSTSTDQWSVGSGDWGSFVVTVKNQPA